MAKNKKEDLVKLNRHAVGTIDLSDIVNADNLSGTDRKNYLENAEILFQNPVLMNELKRAIQLQVEFIACQAVDFEQVLVGRGGVNMGEILVERFSMLHAQYKESTKPEETFDPQELI